MKMKNYIFSLLLTFSLCFTPIPFTAPVQVEAARTFNGTTDKTLYTNPIVSTAPMTLCAWFKASSLATDSRLISITNNVGADGSGWMLYLRSTGAIRARACDNAICDSSTSAGTVSIGTWNQACAVFTSNSSRTAYLNGTAATTATVSLGTISSIEDSVLGAGSYNSGFIDFFAGDLAEPSVWDVALSASDITSLSKGFSPLLIQPSHLKSYPQLFGNNSPETDLKGISWTLTGTSKATHPRIFY